MKIGQIGVKIPTFQFSCETKSCNSQQNSSKRGGANFHKAAEPTVKEEQGVGIWTLGTVLDEA